jgi:hypothetical protein
LEGKSRRIEDELLLSFDQGESRFDYGSVPDTGSSLGVMAYNIAKKYNIKYDSEVEVNLKNASGKYMDVAGLATVWSKPKYINGRLNKHNRRRIQSKYVVTRDMYNEILVSREDLKRFGVIPQCFPKVEVRQTKVEDKIETEVQKSKETAKNNDLPVKADMEMKRLLKKYNDVISDTLTAERFLGEKADIYFNDEKVRPIQRTTAKVPPKAYQKKAQELVDELLKSGVIIEEHLPSKWTSEGKFVEKKSVNGETKLRLVVDYSKLNDSILRPVRGFPTMAELRQFVEPNSEFFMVADLSHGYHQIALSEQASKYTTFVVSCGKGTRRYRWVRAPQGLDCSSDWFNYQSDKVFSHLEGVIKLVDDVLVQAPDWPTFLRRVEKVFDAARRNGVYISEKKIQYGKRVDYAGFVIAREGEDTVLRPDTKLWKVLISDTLFGKGKSLIDFKSFVSGRNTVSSPSRAITNPA